MYQNKLNHFNIFDIKYESSKINQSSHPVTLESNSSQSIEKCQSYSHLQSFLRTFSNNQRL